MPELGCLYKCGACGVETCENCPAYCETCKRVKECEQNAEDWVKEQTNGKRG
jgi:hypothetical protein